MRKYVQNNRYACLICYEGLTSFVYNFYQMHVLIYETVVTISYTSSNPEHFHRRIFRKEVAAPDDKFM